ncbi:MAG: tetratricopeptide repeat protein [Candidatus Poribacteria bacterium]|nr:tetratricopeptide repeat protein [Candidatus Poribacteria bacterium]
MTKRVLFIAILVLAIGSVSIYLYAQRGENNVEIEMEIAIDDAQALEKFAEAKDLENGGDYAKTIEVLKSIAQEFPDSAHAAKAYFEIAQNQFHNLNDPAKALIDYQKVIDAHADSPFYPDALLGKATALENPTEQDDGTFVFPTEDPYPIYVKLTEEHPNTEAGKIAALWKALSDVGKGSTNREDAAKHFQNLRASSDSPLVQAQATYALAANLYLKGFETNTVPFDALPFLQELMVGRESASSFASAYKAPRRQALVYDLATAIYNWADDYKNAFELADYAVKHYPDAVTESTRAIREIALEEITPYVNHPEHFEEKEW